MSKIGKEILEGLGEFVERLKTGEKLHLMKYNDHYGTVHYSDEDHLFYGKLAFIRSLISYEGADVKSLYHAFALAVDDYLLFCKKMGNSRSTLSEGGCDCGWASEKGERLEPRRRRSVAKLRSHAGA